MDKDIFLEDEKEIEKLKDRLEKLKYIQLCFIEQIDSGAIFIKNKNGVSISIKIPAITTDYKLLSDHYSKISNIYSSVTESVDKVKINFEPTVSVTTIDSEIKVTIELTKPEPKYTAVNEFDSRRSPLVNDRDRDRMLEMIRYQRDFHNKTVDRNSRNRYPGDIWDIKY